MLRWCMAALWVSLSSTGWATETTEDDTTKAESAEEAQVAAAAKAAEEAAIRQAQEARIQALEARIDALSAELKSNRKDISKNSKALLPKDALKFDLEGYYRIRAQSFHNLFVDQDGGARQMQHRLRMRPVIEYKDLAKFVMQIDALDNVVWGTTNRWPPPLCLRQILRIRTHAAKTFHRCACLASGWRRRHP